MVLYDGCVTVLCDFSFIAHYSRTTVMFCRMISVYGGFGLVPGARNAWSYWIDHILKQREKFGFMAAAMITTQGAVSAFTKDFLPTTAEVQVKWPLFVVTYRAGWDVLLSAYLKGVKISQVCKPIVTLVRFQFHLSSWSNSQLYNFQMPPVDRL